WPSFLTQSRPGVHGVYHHLQWNPANMRIERVEPHWLGPVEPFWRKISQAGKRVIAFDVPFQFQGSTHVPLAIANLGSHDLAGPFWSSERTESDLIQKRYGPHPMRYEIPIEKTETQRSRIQDQIIKGAALKTDIAIDLLRRRPWDLALVVFGEMHRAGHVLWP